MNLAITRGDIAQDLSLSRGLLPGGDVCCNRSCVCPLPPWMSGLAKTRLRDSADVAYLDDGAPRKTSNETSSSITHLLVCCGEMAFPLSRVNSQPASHRTGISHVTGLSVHFLFRVPWPPSPSPKLVRSRWFPRPANGSKRGRGGVCCLSGVLAGRPPRRPALAAASGRSWALFWASYTMRGRGFLESRTQTRNSLHLRARVHGIDCSNNRSPEACLGI